MYTIQCNTIQYNTIQYNTIQYNTIQYNTIQYNTAICVQAQTANTFARLFTFETGRLPLETEMFHRSCDVSH
jgi:hypothetical protein